MIAILYFALISFVLVGTFKYLFYFLFKSKSTFFKGQAMTLYGLNWKKCLVFCFFVKLYF